MVTRKRMVRARKRWNARRRLARMEAPCFAIVYVGLQWLDLVARGDAESYARIHGQAWSGAPTWRFWRKVYRSQGVIL